MTTAHNKRLADLVAKAIGSAINNDEVGDWFDLDEATDAVLDVLRTDRRVTPDPPDSPKWLGSTATASGRTSSEQHSAWQDGWQAGWEAANSNGLGPDEFHCRKCGRPVRYASVQAGRSRIRASFDAAPVPNGGWSLTEMEVPDLDGVLTPTGDWLGTYVKVADRDRGSTGYRQHDCRPL